MIDFVYPVAPKVQYLVRLLVNSQMDWVRILEGVDDLLHENCKKTHEVFRLAGHKVPPEKSKLGDATCTHHLAPRLDHTIDYTILRATFHCAVCFICTLIHTDGNATTRIVPRDNGSLNLFTIHPLFPGRCLFVYYSTRSSPPVQEEVAQRETTR